MSTRRSGIANQASRGLANASADYDVPIGFGLLTCDNDAQAEARAGGVHGNKGWDDHLIPGAKDVKPLYTFEEKETGRREWEVPGPNVAEMVDKKPHLLGAPAALANPADIQEVRMPNGVV